MPTGQYAVADAKPIGQYSLSDVTPEEEPSSKGGLLLAAAGALEPLAATTARAFVQSPNVAPVAAKIGRVVGGLAPIVGGAQAAGLPGAMMGVAGSAKGAWAGGKTGWFTGKLLQNVSKPVADVLEKAAPYAQTLATLGGAQSALDLAQMAEPERRDIGMLGVGPTSEGTPTLKEPKAQLASVQYLIDTKGVSPSEAVKQITGNDSRLFGPLMTLYMRSRMKP